MQVKDLATYDMVGLFFSGHWCPPSQQFTPLLAHAYKTMRAAGKNVEIVFLSSDQDQAQTTQHSQHSQHSPKAQTQHSVVLEPLAHVACTLPPRVLRAWHAWYPTELT